jgi:hypothetical protein
VDIPSRDKLIPKAVQPQRITGELFLPQNK